MHIIKKEGVTETVRLCSIKQLMKGDNMSYSTNAAKNKQQKHSKVHFSQYLYNSSEPEADNSHDILAVQDAVAIQQADRYYMVIKRKLRRSARKMRTQHASDHA